MRRFADPAFCCFAVPCSALGEGKATEGARAPKRCQSRPREALGRRGEAQGRLSETTGPPKGCGFCPTNVNHNSGKPWFSALYLLPFTFYLIPVTFYLLPFTFYLIPDTLYLLPFTFCLSPSTLYHISFYLIPCTFYLIPYTFYFVGGLSSPARYSRPSAA